MAKPQKSAPKTSNNPDKNRARLQALVWQSVFAIPRGKVATYGQIATDGRSSRAIPNDRARTFPPAERDQDPMAPGH